MGSGLAAVEAGQVAGDWELERAVRADQLRGARPMAFRRAAFRTARSRSAASRLRLWEGFSYDWRRFISLKSPSRTQIRLNFWGRRSPSLPDLLVTRIALYYLPSCRRPGRKRNPPARCAGLLAAAGPRAGRFRERHRALGKRAANY